MKQIASGRPDDLNDERVGVLLDQTTEDRTLFQLGFKTDGGQAIRLTGDLHDGLGYRSLLAEKDGDTQHPLITDRRDRQTRAVVHDLEQRDDGRLWKIYMFDRLAQLVEHFAAAIGNKAHLAH